MSRYITTERQARALADSDDLRRRALAVGIPQKQYNACGTLKAAREMVEQVEAALYAPALDNSDRIAALFAEYAQCNDFKRALEIEQALHDYGVEAVTEEENRKLEKYAELRTGYRSL